MDNHRRRKVVDCTVTFRIPGAVAASEIT
jgi:hypothetical protein